MIRLITTKSKNSVIVLLLLSSVSLFVTPWTVSGQAPLSSTISQRLLKFMSIELVMLSVYHILCRSILLLPTIFLSIRVFSIDSTLHQMAKVLELHLQQQSFQ